MGEGWRDTESPQLLLPEDIRLRTYGVEEDEQCALADLCGPWANPLGEDVAMCYSLLLPHSKEGTLRYTFIHSFPCQ